MLGTDILGATPDAALLWCARARWWYLNGQVDSAALANRQSTAIDSLLGPARLLAAELALLDGDLARAGRDAAAAGRIMPWSADAMAVQARLAELRGDTTGAIALWSKALTRRWNAAQGKL